MASQYNDFFKIVVSGDSGVGKSCLISRYIHKEFPETSFPTIGLDFAMITEKIDSRDVDFQIWDTAGQEKMKSVSTAYYRSSVGAVLVFDITNRASFDNLVDWITEIMEFVEEGKMSMILIGNKLDLESDRIVSQQLAVDFAKEHQLFYMEVSAKEDPFNKVEEAIRVLLNEIVRKHKSEKKEENPTGIGEVGSLTRLDSPVKIQTKHKSSCCK